MKKNKLENYSHQQSGKNSLKFFELFEECMKLFFGYIPLNFRNVDQITLFLTVFSCRFLFFLNSFYICSTRQMYSNICLVWLEKKKYSRSFSIKSNSKEVEMVYRTECLVEIKCIKTSHFRSIIIYLPETNINGNNKHTDTI